MRKGQKHKQSIIFTGCLIEMSKPNIFQQNVYVPMQKFSVFLLVSLTKLDSADTALTTSCQGDISPCSTCNSEFACKFQMEKKKQI